MSFIGKALGMSPPTPPAFVAAPPPPQAQIPQVTDSDAAQQQRAAAAAGSQANVATSAQGVTDGAPTTNKQLTGQ